MPPATFNGDIDFNSCSTGFNASTAIDPMLDVAADFANFDFLELVTYRIRGAGETFTEVADVNALPRVPTSDEEELIGKTGLVWHVSRCEIGECKPRDVIERGDGTQYVVQAAALQTFATRYKLLCKKARE